MSNLCNGQPLGKPPVFGLFIPALKAFWGPHKNVKNYTHTQDSGFRISNHYLYGLTEHPKKEWTKKGKPPHPHAHRQQCPHMSYIYLYLSGPRFLPWLDRPTAPSLCYLVSVMLNYLLSRDTHIYIYFICIKIKNKTQQKSLRKRPTKQSDQKMGVVYGVCV